MLKAGFIGYRGFANKLKDLFEDEGVKKFVFYHPIKKKEGVSNDLNELFSCDFIVIVSPDITHGEYLRKLKDYKGYIFCEKIPVLDKKDLDFLKKEKNDKLYFNFCYRKGKLCNLLKETKEILHITHTVCNGLGLLEKYKDNWRSDPLKAPLGVFQLSGIHLFDLLIFVFGKPKSYSFSSNNVSPYGSSIDNFRMSLEFNNGLFAELFFSYTSPFSLETRIISKENLITITDSEIVVNGPRETFKDGRFVKPPEISKERINIYEEALKSSVKYFLKTMKSNGKFQEKNNLLSTELVLDMLEEVKK